MPIPPAVEVVDFFPQAAMAKKAIRTEAAKRTGARRSLRCAPGRGAKNQIRVRIVEKANSGIRNFELGGFRLLGPGRDGTNDETRAVV